MSVTVPGGSLFEKHLGHSSIQRNNDGYHWNRRITFPPCTPVHQSTRFKYRLLVGISGICDFWGVGVFGRVQLGRVKGAQHRKDEPSKSSFHNPCDNRPIDINYGIIVHRIYRFPSSISTHSGEVIIPTHLNLLVNGIGS